MSDPTLENARTAAAPSCNPTSPTADGAPSPFTFRLSIGLTQFSLLSNKRENCGQSIGRTDSKGLGNNTLRLRPRCIYSQSTTLSRGTIFHRHTSYSLSTSNILLVSTGCSFLKNSTRLMEGGK
eukprot:sb/3475745/